MNDPYETLEVSKNAKQDEIKKAYRRLAKKYHPDFNPGNKEAEKKFKSIQHAFDLIGTPDARAKWDKGETDEQQQKKYEEYQRRSQEKPFYYNTQDTGGRYSYSFDEDLGTESFFEGLFGGKGRRQGGRRRHDENYQMEVDFKDAAIGGEKVITLPNGKALQVKIPAGIDEGKKLKFKDMGENGDVYVEIKVRPLAGFKRDGLTIETEVPISFFEALLGGEIQVPTIEGNVLLQVPPGVSTGTKLRIKGKGAGSGETRGNQLVVLKVVMPKDIGPGLREEALKLKARYDYDPRKPL